MEYTELKCFNLSNPELRDFLTAELSEIGFESFVDDVNSGLLAYIQKKDFSENDIEILKSRISEYLTFEYISASIPDQNWNAKWEENYDAVLIDDLVEIRAPFHNDNPNAKYHIVIEPKMSFGTAHHPTTAQMISLMKDEKFENKSVLDMGCGTAVLGIFAKMLGASDVVAIDNDEWAYNNSLENVQRNNFDDIILELGDASLLKNRKFDFILANINRNILVKDMSIYSNCLLDKGVILFSGFFEGDLEIIKQSASDNSLIFDKYICFNNWTAARFYKV